MQLLLKSDVSSFFGGWRDYKSLEKYLKIHLNACSVRDALSHENIIFLFVWTSW